MGKHIRTSTADLDRRTADNKRRINEGSHNGQLTRGESGHLRGDLNSIERQRDGFERSGGRYTENERQTTKKRLDGLGREITRESRDLDQDWNQRMRHDGRRIDRGFDRGAYTRGEARSLDRDLGRNHDLYRDLRHGGLSLNDRRRLDGSLDHLDRRLSHEARDNQFRHGGWDRGFDRMGYGPNRDHRGHHGECGNDYRFERPWAPEYRDRQCAPDYGYRGDFAPDYGFNQRAPDYGYGSQMPLPSYQANQLNNDWCGTDYGMPRSWDPTPSYWPQQNSWGQMPSWNPACTWTQPQSSWNQQQPYWNRYVQPQPRRVMFIPRNMAQQLQQLLQQRQVPQPRSINLPGIPQSWFHRPPVYIHL